MQFYSGLSRGFRLLIISGFLLLVGLLFVRFVGTGSVKDRLYAPEKVNLALRRTADQLLRAAGDSTSRIPAVQQANPETFRIQLAHDFDYDRLPDLLQESFQLHRVTGMYAVAVLDCASGELQLGYSVNDLLGGKPIPCLGRSIKAGCYVVQVTFETPASPFPRIPLWPIFSMGGLLVGFLFVVWRLNGQKNTVSDPVVSPRPSPSLIHFGRSSLDIKNLALTADTHRHNLTYREAKLLRLLVSHPNQVLERDQILKLVWEDEGITVGRSVDVFISRLRKLLQPDATVKIAAVHGVGYRMEIQDTIF